MSKPRLPSVRRARRPEAPRALALLLCAMLVPTAGGASGVAEGHDPDGFRIGLTVGGTGFFGFGVEYRSGSRGIELALGTFSFRDVSLAVSGKQYIGGGDARAFLGLGLWSLVALPAEPDERVGAALILRAPLGGEWSFVDPHAGGVELALNRALAIRRTDPEDPAGPRGRIVPLPAFYYRYDGR